MSYQQFRPNSFKVLPPVVKNLLIINGLMFLATVVFQERLAINLTQLLGLHLPMASDFRPYQIITYMFMHGSLTHVFFNMFALWMFGNTLENYWGPKRFLVYYIVTGIGAAICHYIVIYYQIAPILIPIDNFLQNPSIETLEMFAASQNQLLPSQFNSQELIQNTLDQLTVDREHFLNRHIMVGASGSVFGILLAFGMLFPNTLLYVYFAIPVKAKWFVLFYGIAELYAGIANNPGDNIAHFAHLGGMLFGFVLIKVWNKNRSNFY